MELIKDTESVDRDQEKRNNYVPWPRECLEGHFSQHILTQGFKKIINR
jgi:hypothetical protein